MASTKRCTTTPLAAAVGSIRLMVPYRSLEMWWSMTISSCAPLAAGSRSPSREIEPQSKVTITDGVGREVGRGREKVEAREVAVVRSRLERRREGRDGLDPGAAQHVQHAEHRAERVAVGIHVAREGHDVGVGDLLRGVGDHIVGDGQFARPHRSLVTPTCGISVEGSDDVLHTLPGFDRRIELELQSRHVLQPHLTPQYSLQVRCRRLEPRFDFIVLATERAHSRPARCGDPARPRPR